MTRRLCQQRSGHRVARRQYRSAARSTPTQYHGFGYFEDILDADNRLSLIVGTSNGNFQIPNQRGLQPSTGPHRRRPDRLSERRPRRESARADELRDRQLAAFARARSTGRPSFSTRYSRLAFTPSPLGDLLYDGHRAERLQARHRHSAGRPTSRIKLNDAHTLRAGWYVQHDDARTDATSQVLPTDAAGIQTSDVPITIADNGSPVAMDRKRSICRMNGARLSR